jgi:hypothetical protein
MLAAGACAGAIAALAAVALGACAASPKEIGAAQSSVYDTDFAIAFSEALAAVHATYPNSEDDPIKGTIKTAWHQVGAESPDDDPNAVAARDPSGLNSGGAGGFTGTQTRALRRTFIRFDVTVTGGRPWRVRVVGRAAEWDPGNAVPTELRGGDAPPWLEGRTNALVVAIHRRLAAYAKPAPKAAEPVVEQAPVDLAAFGPIPAPAARAVAAVRRALDGRDMTALRAAVAADVVWSFGAAPGADGALATWQADPETFEHMAATLDAGCRAEKPALVSCPPQASEQPGYIGWRATFEPRDGRWLMTAFVQGD